MLTVVTLLLLPAVLGMAIFRICQLPRGLFSRRQHIRPRKPLIAALGLGLSYSALLVYTVFVLNTAARAVWTPPKTIQELFGVASVGVAYPFVYLAFEWLLHYCIKPGARA